MKKRLKQYKRIAGRLFFCLYIIILSYFLFFSESFGRGISTEGYRYNLQLLQEIKRFCKYREQVGFSVYAINILGNVIAFMPFGFLLPLLDKRYRRFFYVAFLSILFSFSVEVIQMLTRVGIFDVDDILLNTIGGIMGYLLYAICNRFYGRLHGKRSRRRRQGNV